MYVPQMALTSQQIQDFKKQPLVKSFYKFISTHHLREQALSMVDTQDPIAFGQDSESNDVASYEDLS